MKIFLGAALVVLINLVIFLLTTFAHVNIFRLAGGYSIIHYVLSLLTTASLIAVLTVLGEKSVHVILLSLKLAISILIYLLLYTSHYIPVLNTISTIESLVMLAFCISLFWISDKEMAGPLKLYAAICIILIVINKTFTYLVFTNSSLSRMLSNINYLYVLPYIVLLYINIKMYQKTGDGAETQKIA